MNGDFDSVSSTDIRELEKEWLSSRKGIAKHLRVHQCLTAFLNILGTDGNSEKCLDELFKEIGRRLDLSPYTVRQNLQDAANKKGGILHVSAPLAISVGTELQHKLSELLPLISSKGSESTRESSLRVIVGEVKNRYSPQKEDRVNAAAEAAAEYFVNVVPEKCLADDDDEYTSGWIGVSGGNTMLKVVQCIDEARQGQYERLTVIPLAGEAEPEKFGISANSVVLRLAGVCVPGKAKTFSLMTTPIVADDDLIENQRKAQESSPSIKQVIDRAKRVKFAFTGIGSIGSKDDALLRLANHCGIDDDIPSDVVGDICYRPINKDGKDAWQALSSRLVGPDLKDLKAMAASPERRVFAVACGTKKVKPVIAAFRGGLVNGLITDELTALEILDHLDNEAPID